MNLGFPSPRKIRNWISQLLDQYRRRQSAKNRYADKKTIRLFGEAGHRGTALSIEPLGSREVFFESVPEGDYKLLITHQEKMLHKDRKALTANFSTSDLESGEQVASELRLLFSAQGEPFSYIGGGRLAKGQFTQITKIRIASERDWIAVRLDSKLDRYVNIDNIRFTPDIINLKRRQSNIAQYVVKLLESRDDLFEAEFVLYADINLNVVDGSSVWLSSMLSALASVGKTLVFSKQDIHSDVIWSNVKNQENILVLSPKDFRVDDQIATPEVAIALIRQLDEFLPNVRRVVIRGLNAASMLCEDRQFRGRSAIYLTDFYEIEGGELVVDEKATKTVTTIASQAGYLLSQTSALSQKISDVSGLQIDCHRFPPPIPDDLPVILSGVKSIGPVKIGYAGKITPLWGVDQMLDWTEELAQDGVRCELHIVANRISDGVGKKNVPGFGQSMRSKIERSSSSHYGDFNREAAMGKMAEMDFVWCYRPPDLEENTLEVSTKLIEMVGAGAACLCFPSDINRRLLGEDYPYFIKDVDDLRRLLKSQSKSLPKGLSERIRSDHSLEIVSDRLAKSVLGKRVTRENAPTLVVAGHDFKFVDPYVSHLKANGHRVFRDTWEWGGPKDLDSTRRLQAEADVIFCEWGLANAVWHSENKREGTKLFVRIHLQEIDERASKFGYKMDQDAVDGYIFVEEGVRRTAIEMFDIPWEKTHLIPNFLLDDEYQDNAHTKHNDEIVRLGMVGIIPQRKRFDLAVELLARLIDDGKESSLAIKGPRPEHLDFMRAPERALELEYYQEVYDRIAADPRLTDAVSFEPWGNDVSSWYRNVDFILSPSDFESFHYAVADGILSGCTPLIWSWEGADEVYDPNWIIGDTDEALAQIEKTRSLSQSERLKKAAQKRELLTERYSYTKVFDSLSRVLGIEGGPRRSPRSRC